MHHIAVSTDPEVPLLLSPTPPPGDPVDPGRREHSQQSGAGPLQLGVLLLREVGEGAGYTGALWSLLIDIELLVKLSLIDTVILDILGNLSRHLHPPS